MINYYIAWWNLENLFDIENSPNRTDKLNRTLKNELTGWSQDILDTKIANLAEIINSMNDNNGPDILGVCEIENSHVLELLLKNLIRPTYLFVHADTKDQRGIDVAFIYDKELFDIKKEEIFSHYVMKSNATRDLLQVSFYPEGSVEPIVIIGNHWPSRSGGQYESEPYRMIAGETLSYYHKRILEEQNKNTPVIAIGDFNDEPFNRAIIEYALSVNSALKRTGTRRPYFYNLMWKPFIDGSGTYYFNGFNMLDQIMVSKSILDENSKVRYVNDSCRIEKFSKMMKNGKPVRFGRPTKGLNKKGYSDHFPISFKLEYRA
jgi:predicted extracellular nuclease